LLAYNDQYPAPSDLKTPADLENHLVSTLRGRIDQLAPKENAAWWQADSALLRASHRVRVGFVNPPPRSVTSQEVRRAQCEGATVAHYTIGRRPTGERIPVVRLMPAHASGRATLIVHPRGKAGLVEADGTLSPLVRALLAVGQNVIGFDPFLIGESADPAAFRTRRPDTLHYETYNPALAADRMQDLATVLAWLQARPDALEVSLIGQGTAGPLALLARPALQGIARTAVDLHGFDYGEGSAEIPAALDLPGVLQFGGLKAAAALSAPAPLWIHGTAGKFDINWARTAYALTDAPEVLRIMQDRARPEELARWIDSGEG
jgi:hypothetical protein